ncbi:Kinesin domain-containing protein [Cephalotus follicularis]|uniref:Kinesin domain-containing protein n=1 Tax=Cephalotus follicularis TaxID=3775 RepID=A0A1Q3B8K2_CEPFO|nr:Kinesin domain-containing protein [Cephalotus follicularis]
MGSSPNSLNGQPPDSPSVPAIFTDVNVVPEQDKNQLEQLIANLEGEILQLRQKQNLFDKKRREALNKLIDMKGSIRVFCRVRPYLMKSRRKIREPISTGSEMIVVRSSGIRKEFNFDKVFPQEASQEEIFVEIAPLLRSALDGHHVSILAFGQTGTGKTFTMDGTNDQIGIIPRALEELFSQASLDKSSSLNFSMSMLEVYMGNLRDLLSPKPPYRAYEAATRYNLNIQTDPKGLVEIEGLTEVQIPDFGKARWWYNKGKRVRSTSWTNVNEASSRSHCLTRITVFRRGDALEANTEVSKLWMVDLGGSERLLKTGATGQTLDEGRAINLSISALGDVIAALKRKRGHVPYRNSKLTQILKDSLGDGSKVLMLVHVSPCEEDVGETICSLNFAKRARAVESVKELPEELKKHRERRIVELEKDMREAEEEIQKITKQIQKAEFLLSENKKLFSTPNKSFEAAEKNLQGPNEDLKEVIRTTQKSEKASRRSVGSSLPRFMTSTVASRQRQSIAEREIVGKVTSLQSGTRNSVQLSGSQSLSFSDFRFKSIVRSSNKKTRHGEMNANLTVSPKCKDLDLKVPSLPRSKMVTSSDPNLRVTLCRHKRRMSDFI